MCEAISHPEMFRRSVQRADELVRDGLNAADYIQHVMHESTDGHLVRAFTVRVKPSVSPDTLSRLLEIGHRLRFRGWHSVLCPPEYHILLFLNEAGL